MNYLTQAVLDYEAAARGKLRDVYDWHQLVWNAFPGRDSQPRDFLTRLDRRERDRQFRLLIVSPRPPIRPDMWPNGPGTWQSQVIGPAFFSHRNYRFQLRANPTKRDIVSRKRLPLRTTEEQAAWLCRKASQSGFAVDEEVLRMTPEGREWFRIEKRSQSGFHHSVDFEGVLIVTDETPFETAFIKGIGSAKGFGFGLLSLAPLGPSAP